jgi:ABC-type multidrug transport system ATPase subunit
MEVRLNNVAKKFNKEWIFKNVNLQIKHSDVIAITGPNGSGKSTLMQVIAGSLLQTSGNIDYAHEGKSIDPDHIYKYLSLVAPAMSLPEDFTLREFISFHFKFKSLKPGFMINDLPGIFRLEKSKDKYIKNFSTGMKQRLKLGIAFYADSPLLLLDEPTTNLDNSGFDWYLEEIDKVLQEKVIFVCSNRKDEFEFCKKFINILDYKN